MSYKKLLIALPLVACLASCGNITATTEISNDDISTTSESISEVNEPTCPFASFESSAVRVTTAAYVPYLLEVDESNTSILSDALINLSWEKISPNTEYMGGETQLVFVNNNGNPFKLVFYADGVIDYEYNGVVEKYKVSDENIFSLVYEIAHPENFEDITDTLIWCAPEYLTNEKVWNEHNYQLIDVEPQCAPAFGFECELPDTLTYEVVQTDDEPTSTLRATIYPIGENTPIISIEYTNGFGVCGTGLETKSIDFNGCSASQGFYDDNDMWSFISLHDDYEGCVVLMQDEKLFNQYADEMNIILETLHFRNYEGNTNIDDNNNINLCWKVNGTDYDSVPVNLSIDDSNSIKGIIDSCKWDTGTADCYNDYVFTRPDGTNIYYHSECGTFNDNMLGRSYPLLDEQKIYVNEVLNGIFEIVYSENMCDGVPFVSTVSSN